MWPSRLGIWIFWCRLRFSRPLRGCSDHSLCTVDWRWRADSSLEIFRRSWSDAASARGIGGGARSRIPESLEDPEGSHEQIRWLIGGLEHGFYDFPETVGNGMSSSQLLLTPSFFRGVGQPPTRWDWHCSTSNWMVGPCHVLRHWRWESTLSCCTSSVFPVLDQPRNLEMLVQLWPFISYNWLFLWDHTFYKWGFVSTYNW